MNVYRERSLRSRVALALSSCAAPLLHGFWHRVLLPPPLGSALAGAAVGATMSRWCLRYQPTFDRGAVAVATSTRSVRMIGGASEIMSSGAVDTGQF
jgi:hypothetical protein